ncbi:DUF6647 family protein [Inquilinus sp. OTU3971]|uniref:DUF6647 family protein n=1 Tax=Inquilinus sp. OTU3971 TaxID=3043855 RepID=UPI00313B5979
MFPAAVSLSGEVPTIDSVIQESMTSPLQIVRLPGTAFDIVVGAAAIKPGSTEINAELLTAIVGWLSSNYDLPANYDRPAIEFVPAETMVALRHDDVRVDLWSGSQADVGRIGASLISATTVALYDDTGRIMYLPETWIGSTPVELSVLVHEMVHHLQNLAGIKFACLEAREKLAYAAQQDWLALFGHDFFADFESDPFTVLVRTSCL